MPAPLRHVVKCSARPAPPRPYGDCEPHNCDRVWLWTTDFSCNAWPSNLPTASLNSCSEQICASVYISRKHWRYVWGLRQAFCGAFQIGKCSSCEYVGQILMPGFRACTTVDRAQTQCQRHHHRSDCAQRNEYIDIGEDRRLTLHRLADDRRGCAGRAAGGRTRVEIASLNSPAAT